MKKYLIMLCGLAMAFCLNSCGGGDGDGEKTSKPATKPLNITVFIDLSDRVTRDNVVPSQPERDTAVVNLLVDYFINRCVEQKIVPCKDCMRVLFYPTPNNPAIVGWASDLKVDLSTEKVGEKRKVLAAMKNKFDASLNNIYKEVLGSKEWLGCDIWAFFSGKKVDVQCMKDGYRNILIILTDGYLYYAPNKVKQGDAYSYVLPETLKNPNSSLIVKRKGLKDLEVLVLEVNPYAPDQKPQLFSVLETWFTGMEVGKLDIVETDITPNVQPYIEAFLK